MGGKKEKGVGLIKHANAPKMTLKQKKKAALEATLIEKVTKTSPINPVSIKK